MQNCHSAAVHYSIFLTLDAFKPGEHHSETAGITLFFFLQIKHETPDSRYRYPFLCVCFFLGGGNCGRGVGSQTPLSGSEHKTAVHEAEPSDSTDGSGARRRSTVDGDRKGTELSTGRVGSRVAVINGGGRERDSRFGVDQNGEGSDFPVIGPPKRVMLLPGVHPR